jgi:ComF family protein
MTMTLKRESAGRLSWMVDWLYPPRCRACARPIRGDDAEFFCAACWGHIQLVSSPQCEICGAPFLGASGGDHTCGPCLARRPVFVRARAWACYPTDESADHPLRQVVQKFKYGRKVSFGKPLGRLLTSGCRDFWNDSNADLIVAVPLHPKRLRWRGFNQSVLLARQVSRAANIPLDLFTLYRSKETPPQTQLNEEERRRNVRAAFAVRPQNSIGGKTILLVDDVYTSGATVNECSRVLKQAGAEAVYVLTLARAVW